MIELENTIQSHFYWVVAAQIFVTLTLVPLLCYWFAQKQLNHASGQLSFELNKELQEIGQRYLNRFILVACLTFLFAAWLLWNAWSNETELLSWDNQSGLIIFGMIAALPIIFTDIALSKVRAFLRSHGPSERTALLLKRNWIGLLPRNSILALVLLNAFVVSVVIYSFYHPFPGFAGWPNFIGLFVINLIFIANLYFTCQIKRWPATMSAEQKQYEMQKIAKVIAALWSLALFYLGVTFVLSHLGPQTEYIKLASQSVYFQVMYLTALLFVKSESS